MSSGHKKEENTVSDDEYAGKVVSDDEDAGNVVSDDEDAANVVSDDEDADNVVSDDEDADNVVSDDEDEGNVVSDDEDEGNAVSGYGDSGNVVSDDESNVTLDDDAVNFLSEEEDKIQKRSEKEIINFPYSDGIDDILVEKVQVGKGAFGTTFKGTLKYEFAKNSPYPYVFGKVYAVKEQLITDISARTYLADYVTSQNPTVSTTLPVAIEIDALRKITKRGCGTHVATLYDVLYNTNTYTLYYVMEYIDGIDLSIVEKTLHVLKNINIFKISEQQLLDHIALPLISGLICMHSNGIAHRDIKSDNIMLSSETGRAKWIDFGLSCVDTCTYKNLLQHGSGQAPETAWSNTNLDKSLITTWTTADVWAFGCFLYKFITGTRYPLQKLILEAKRKKISIYQYLEDKDESFLDQSGFSNPLSDFPRDRFPLIYEIVKAALQLNPNRRKETWNNWIKENIIDLF
jgi:hypothetical protein